MNLRQHTKTHTGFTLLEVIIASSLTAALMLLVWSLFGTYNRLSEKGDRQATELQLARSLMWQFRHDLNRARTIGATRSDGLRRAADSFVHSPTPAQRNNVGEGRVRAGISSPADRHNVPNAATDPLPSELFPAASGNAMNSLPAGAFLWGNAFQLQMLVPALQDSAAETSDELDRRASHATPHVFELVTYTWRPTSPPRPQSRRAGAVASELDDRSDERLVLGGGEPEPGLTRRVTPWLRLAPPPTKSSPQTAKAQNVSLPQPGPTGDADNLQLSGELSADSVPEVARLRFRYFDGAIWSDDWESGTDGRLPAAVEIGFDLKPATEPIVATQPAVAGIESVEGRSQFNREGPVESKVTDQGPQTASLPTQRNLYGERRVPVFAYRFVIAVDTALQQSIPVGALSP